MRWVAAAARPRGRRPPLRRRLADRPRTAGALVRQRSSTGSARPARSASARPTWPATGPPTTCAGVLSAFAANMRDLVPAICRSCGTRCSARQPPHHDNTIDGARHNIHQHYDLSNDLFKTVPRRVDDLLVRALRRRADGRATTTSRTRNAARSTGCSTPPGSAPAPGCSRSGRAGASSRSGAARRGAQVTS